MELVLELFVTAFVAILFSFVVAKLVAVAMADDVGKDLRFTSSLKVDDDAFDGGSEVVEEKLGPDVVVVEKRSPEDSLEVDSGEAEEEGCGGGMGGGSVADGQSEEVRVLESEEIEKSGNEAEEEERLSEDDGDWEGIERSDLEKKFAAASNFVGGGADRLASDVQMQFYGLHKVALEGPCREAQPMALMLSARAKWNSWQKLGNMNPEMAMEQYIALLLEHVPHWMEDNHEDSKLESSEVGILSRAYTDLTTSPLQPSNSSNDSKSEVKSGIDVDDTSGGPTTLHKDREREAELA